MKRIISGFLALVLALCLSAAAFAAGSAPAALTVSATTGGVTVSGSFEAGSSAAAAAVEILGSGGIVAFQTLAVTDHAFSGTISVPLAAGAAYTLRAADYAGGDWKTVAFTVPAAASAAAAGAGYSLRFETNGGSALAELTGAPGSAVALSGYVPVRAGYTFSGWYADAALTNKVTSAVMTGDLTVYAGWTWNNPFTDVPDGSYYFTALQWAFEKGTAQGRTAVRFDPDGVCTRAQAVTFLWRAKGSPEPKSMVSPFIDLDQSAYYVKAVLWAAENGIAQGAADASFCPNAAVTRAQAVTFLWRAAGEPSAAAGSSFADVGEGRYYTAAVRWAAGRGIAQGTAAATFSPAQTCTRAQIVTFLWRLPGR